jgi:hypothetical protein
MVANLAAFENMCTVHWLKCTFSSLIFQSALKNIWEINTDRTSVWLTVSHHGVSDTDNVGTGIIQIHQFYLAECIFNNQIAIEKS